MITTREAAKRLGVSVELVRKACQAGRLHAQKVGRDWLIRDDQTLRTFVKRVAGRPPGARRRASSQG